VSALIALRERIDADGGLLAGALRPAAEVAAAPAALGDRVAAGPRAAADPAAYAFVVETIREGFLLHCGPAQPARVLDEEDADLALLAGDRLYALGLQRLAELGDLDAVAALADVIALSAQARAAGDEDLVSAVWDAGLVQVGWGDDEALEAARDAVRTGDPSAAHALRAAVEKALSVRPPAA
jgi:hypothetical protein